MALDKIIAKQIIADGITFGNDSKSAEVKKSIDNQTKSFRQLDASTKDLSKSMSSVQSGLSKTANTVAGIAKNFNLAASPLEKFKDSIGNIGKKLSDGFKNPGRSAMKAMNVGGIFNKAIAKSEFIEQQTKLDPSISKETAAENFGKARGLAKDIQKNDAEIERAKQETGLSDEALQRSKGYRNLFDTKEKLANQFKGVDVRAQLEANDTEQSIESAALDKSAIESEKLQAAGIEEINETLKDNQEKQDEWFKKIVDSLSTAGAAGGGFLSSLANAATSIPGKGASYLSKVGGAGTLAKGLGIGAIGAYAGGKIQDGGEYLKEKGYEKTGKAVGVGGTSLKYAGYGAMIGSVIPGVGTAVGGAVGGVLGAGKGIYDQYFSGNEEEEELEKLPDEEPKKSKLSSFMDSMKQKWEKTKFNYNAGIGRGEEYANPDFVDKVLADENASAGDEFMDSTETSNGIEKNKSLMKSQANFKKTVLGSELLGKWFSKKGIETASLMGDKYDHQTTSNTNLGTESDSALNSSIMGSVKSGGLFGKDKYIIDYAQKDAERVYDGSGKEQKLLGGGWNPDEEGLEVTKDQYKHVEDLVAAKKIDEAVDYVSNIRREQMLNSPNIGDNISEASTDAEMAKMNAQKPSANIVNAPTTTNVSNQNSNNIIASRPRNDEASINKFNNSRWGFDF